ncbi:MAG: SRPBCC family protein [Bacteroidota bacterium]
MRSMTILLSLLAAINVEAQEGQPTNKHFWHTEKTGATPSDIWSIWTDVANWSQWDTGLKDASLKGKFELGAKGSIITLDGRKIQFKVVAYEEGKSYTYRIGLPLGSLNVRRFLETIDGQTVFTHDVRFKGLTSGIFAKSLGKEFRAMLPEVLQNIKNIAEQ